MDYEEIYKNWDNLPQGRILVDAGDGGENLWARELPDGTVGIDNNPLTPDYRYQDIIQPGSDRPDLVHRRWHHDLWFQYDANEDDEEDLKIRKHIVASIRLFGGDPNFWTKGVGHSLCQTLEDVSSVKDALENLDLGIVFNDSASPETH